MQEILAAVTYKNADLINKVRQEADKKFSGNSYVKNLWVLKEYKKRGGKVSYKGKKPSNKNIKEQVSASFGDHILSMVDEWEEVEFDEDDLDENLTEEEALAFSEEKVSEIYTKYHQTVNMSYSELKKWSENPCSKAASLSRGPINRNLNLLSKPKEKWTANDARSANRTISFVSRMKGAEQGEKVKGPDGQSCPSKRDISLMNWAFRP